MVFFLQEIDLHRLTLWVCFQVVRPHVRGGLVAGFRMRRPGAYHKARFMHDSLYLMKLSLLSRQFRLPQHLKRQVLALCEFICLLYVPYFLQSPLAAAAPRLDRDFWLDLQSYRVLITIHTFVIISLFVHKMGTLIFKRKRMWKNS